MGTHWDGGGQALRTREKALWLEEEAGVLKSGGRGGDSMPESVYMEVPGGQLGTQHRKTGAVSVDHNKCPSCMPLSTPSLARQGPVSSSEFGRKVASGEPRFNEKDDPLPKSPPASPNS